MKTKDIILTLRPYQWYKNILVFVAIFFSGNLFVGDVFLRVVIGFVALSLVSSSGYIINDIIDRENDRRNPEKRRRSIAAGKISVNLAVILSALSGILGATVAFFIDVTFFYVVLVLFGLMQAYTFWLKKIVMVDTVVISVNNVLRAMGGAFIIGVIISPWLILGIFFLSFFLATGKRVSELTVHEGRQVLRWYNPKRSNALLGASTILLLGSYILFSFFSIHPYLYLSVPIVVFPLFRFIHLAHAGHVIPRHLELMWKDGKLIGGMVASAAVIFFIVYGGAAYI